MIECEDSVIRTQAQVATQGQTGIRLKRISPVIGVEVSGIDLREPLNDAQAKELLYTYLNFPQKAGLSADEKRVVDPRKPQIKDALKGAGLGG